MIKYLPYNEIKRNKWDACIENSINGNVFAFSWYLDSACEQWDALVEDDYCFVMPLPYRKKLGFAYVFPPSLIQQLGIFSAFKITASKVEEFVKAIPPKFKYAEILLNHCNPVETLDITRQQHTNLELDLNRPYSELQRAYSENLRRNLKKIPENFFSIRKSENIDGLIGLFRSTRETKIGCLPKDFYQVLHKIFAAATNNSCKELWQVYSGDELFAGVLFVSGCHKAVFLFSASSDKAKKHHAMHYLVDRFIEAHAGNHLILDFEGSDNETLARFYRNFGATEKNYTKIEFSKLPGFIIKSLKLFFKIKK